MSSSKSNEKYYVSVKPQTDGIHSIHREGCPFMPDDTKRIYIGSFDSSGDAVKEGKYHFPGSACCRFCMKSESDDRFRRIADKIMPSLEQLNDFTTGKVLYILN
jgi:hypothetical protein